MRFWQNNYVKAGIVLIFAFILFLGLGYFSLHLSVEADEEITPLNPTDAPTSALSSSAKLNNHVDIKGAVKKPGVYAFSDGDKVIDAITKAGGLKSNADTSNINLAQKLTPEMVIYVFTSSEIKQNNAKSTCQTTCQVETITPTMPTTSQGTTKTTNTHSLMVNINTASKNELMQISGIGSAKADAIIAYREHERFTSIDDIKKVSGIGDVLFEQIKAYITV